ncbi:hypothetical protein [Haloechinothrix salitolerans]|uniref:HAMP domain-containing protein n=1 Tax=Haloechinothrix salitolerans TaxID=926830 RepID=A0ABW2C1Z3_9PSEU
MDNLSTGGAIMWWIGVAVLFLVVIPLVLALSLMVLRRLREIRDYAADVLDNGVRVTANLEPVPALHDTLTLTASVADGLRRYVGAVSRLLPGGNR